MTQESELHDYHCSPEWERVESGEKREVIEIEPMKKLLPISQTMLHDWVSKINTLVLSGRSPRGKGTLVLIQVESHTGLILTDWKLP